MPPRLPLRHPVELVHLGVLLPWAARASSTAAAAACPLPAPASPSDDVTDAAVQPTAGPSTPRPPCPQPPQTSLIHHLLSLPSPPSQDTLLRHLLDHPDDLTRPAGELLVSYARRVSDIKAEREVWELMVRRGVVPVGMARKARFVHDGEAGAGAGPAQWQWRAPAAPSSKGKAGNTKADARAKSKTKVNLPALPGRTPPKINSWAAHLWPPLESLPADERYTIAQLMGHLHFLLLMGKQPTLEEAWRLLPEATDYQEAVGEQGGCPTRVQDAKSHARVKGKGKGKMDEAGHYGLNLFNLYLAYPSESPLNLLTTYLTLSSFLPNRQSLHLTILALLSPPSSQPLPLPRAPSPYARSRALTAVAAARTPSSPSEISTAVLSTLNCYLAQRTTPHLDTWRHIAQFALFHDLQELGRLAFEAWFATLEGLEKEVARAWGQADVEAGAERGAERGERREDSEGMGGGEVERPFRTQLLTPPPTTAPPTSQSWPPRFVFAGFGAKKWFWTKICRAMEEKGWVGRVEEVKGAVERGKDAGACWGYVWKKAEGEDEGEGVGVRTGAAAELGVGQGKGADGVREKLKREMEMNLAAAQERIGRTRYPLYCPTATAATPSPPKAIPPASTGVGVGGHFLSRLNSPPSHSQAHSPLIPAPKPVRSLSHITRRISHNAYVDSWIMKS